MSEKDFKTGDLISVRRGGWGEVVGIVSQPISETAMGHVLVYKDGTILGMEASITDVESVGESSEGFAQLGYHLIKLGSKVIEQKLIVYRA